MVPTVGREVYSWLDDCQADTPEDLGAIELDLSTYYTSRVEGEGEFQTEKLDFYNEVLKEPLDSFRSYIFDCASSIDEGSHQKAYGFFLEAVEASKTIEKYLDNEAPVQPPDRIRANFLAAREDALKGLVDSMDFSQIEDELENTYPFSTQAA